MTSLYRALGTAPAAWMLAAALAAPSARAQEGPSTQPQAPPPPEAPAKPREFEGAVGLVLASKPAFSGSSDRQLKPELAGFLRWGRITITGQGGFTTRARDDVERGLDAELVRREGVRVNLSLRFDPGRRESSSDQLAGLGSIRPTVRARLGVRWEPVPDWQLSLGSSFDALNRVGGYVVSGGVSRNFTIDARQRFIVHLGLSGAGDRYLQAWYGVTPEQSAASGYPVYSPAEGLRDVSLSGSWRVEFSSQWAGFASVGTSRLLGPAAQSPLALQRSGVSLSAGIARRF